MLQLVDPSEKYDKQYEEAYNLTMEAYHNGLIKKKNIMFYDLNETNPSFTLLLGRDISKLKPGWVPMYSYYLVDDDKFIGVINIRTELTDSLLRLGGNIGYCINPKYWRLGYGKKMLELGLLKAKEYVKQDKVLITCDDDNIGSYKIIEANSGILENKIVNEYDGEKFVTRRYWIDL